MINSLVEKLSNFTTKDRLKMQATGNCATQGVLEHSQGACLTGKVQILCLLPRRYCEPMSKGKVGNFSLVGKHLYIGGNQ
jgi:hypothetical protein